ncbi:MAG TPA: hypothetical protein DEA08_24580, partial [Planctomycetes bacterium]|nr:hypothetical protein [Planctomycetota bacterium]
MSHLINERKCKLPIACKISLLVIPLVASLSAGAQAFVKLRTQGGEALRWGSSQVTVTLHQDLAPQISDGSDEVAVREGFRAWERVADSDLSFRFDDAPASRARADWASDDVHMVWFDPNDSSGFFSQGTGLVAITPIDFNPQTGEITDADILVDARRTFSTRGDADAFDLQSVITHEVGHLLGLDHSPVHGSTMTPVPALGDTRLRSLSPDEEAAVRALYPAANAYGALTGVLRRGDGSVVVGAHVVAENLDGEPTAATLSNPDGTFLLEGLPPGDYVVYAEPLIDTFDTRRFDVRTQQRGIDTDFGVTFWGPSGKASDPLSPAQAGVSVGETRSLGSITLRAPGSLHRTKLDSVALEPGDSYRLRAQGSGLTGTRRFYVTGRAGSTPRLSDTIVGLSNGSVKVEIPTTAQPQLHSIRIVNPSNGDCWVLTGGLEVRDPGPILTEISPRQLSAAGERITLRGARLSSGAKVLIGSWLLNTSGSGDQLSFNAPELGAGTYDVTIENPDGRIATLRGVLEVAG